mmetsp:Transcript_6176/g.8616  ORF Transcript_6176/g.8616 Transcript_6176/m.8616 type:complete len:312 (+) Transcript_6176:90-1025(+)
MVLVLQIRSVPKQSYSRYKKYQHTRSFSSASITTDLASRVSSSTKISPLARIGPYCVVGSETILADDVNLLSHVVIGDNTVIKNNTTVFPFACLGMIPQDRKFRGEKTQLVIGQNCTIREHVTINLGTLGGGSKTEVGDNCLIMSGVHIGHDCTIENDVIIASGTSLAGHVQVGQHSVIGGHCGIHQHVHLGKYSYIGAGTIVKKDVIPYALIDVGASPYTAIMKGLNLKGFKRLKLDSDIIKEIKRGYDELFLRRDFTMSFIEHVLKVSKSNWFSFQASQEARKILLDIISFIDSRKDSKYGLCLPQEPQ